MIFAATRISIQPVSTQTASSLTSVSVQPVSTQTATAIAQPSTTVQPVSAVSAAATSALSAGSLSKSIVPTASAFTKVASSVKVQFQPPLSYFHLFGDFLSVRVDLRYRDELLKSNIKFTPYEELSGIAGTRPEILSISEFVPLFEGNKSGYTAAGAFLDAQVKLMNLRHETVAKLVSDLKKGELADQLAQAEGDFKLHLRNLKTHADFLANVHYVSDGVVGTLDIRDPFNRIDAMQVISQYYASQFSSLLPISSELTPYTYFELLSQHGFSKPNAQKFSNTKLFLQTLFEAKKIAKAGTDEVVGVDKNIVLSDGDPALLNRRTYKDPHQSLGDVKQFIPAAEVLRLKVLESDSALRTVLSDFEKGFVGMDDVFAGAVSDEVKFVSKLNTLTREYSYSKALSDELTVKLLDQYGYSISDRLGNQQLFDAVYGQIGNKITDDRSGINQNAMSSVAAKTVDDKAVLTFETGYLDTDDGSTYSPGADYYVRSCLRPSDSGFSLQNASTLAKSLNVVVDKYVDFVGKFNLLPRLGNKVIDADASVTLVSDPEVLANALYESFIDPASGKQRDSVTQHPTTPFLIEAATNARIRANLALYFYFVADVRGEGIASEPLTPLDNIPSQAQLEVRDHNARVSSMIDKLVSNCVNAYKSATGVSNTATLEAALKNFSDSNSVLSRCIALVYKIYNAFIAKGSAVSSSDGKTKYSHISDLGMASLAMQLFLDAAKRYVNLRNTSTSASASSTSKTSTTTLRTANSLVSVSPRFSIATANPTFAGVGKLLNALPTATPDELHRAVTGRLKREYDLLVRTVLAPLATVRACRDSVQRMVLQLQKQESVDQINAILRIVGDRKLVELLMDRGQTENMVDTIDDYSAKAGDESTSGGDESTMAAVLTLSRTGMPDDDLRVLDDSFITSKHADLLRAAFATAQFDAFLGANVRVLSVGLPHGFTSGLRDRFKLTTFAEQQASRRKQNDVVLLDIFKVDVRYPNLVFKPITKVFETSRFPVRNERVFRTAKVGSNLDAVLACIPTRDFSEIGNPVVSYGSEKIARSIEYDFMSDDDREELPNNHIMSYLLEVYFRLLSGAPLSEKELFIMDPDDNDRPAPFVTQAILEEAAKKVFGVPAPQAKKLDLGVLSHVTIQTTAKQTMSTAVGSAYADIKHVTAIDTFSAKMTKNIHAFASAGSDAATKRMVFSDVESSAKRIMSPKLFERVFFVPVDPDDYEIDQDETNKTAAGRSTFTKLLQSEDIVITEELAGSRFRQTYKLRDLRDEERFVFEKYFVTFRSYEHKETQR